MVRIAFSFERQRLSSIQKTKLRHSSCLCDIGRQPVVSLFYRGAHQKLPNRKKLQIERHMKLNKSNARCRWQTIHFSRKIWINSASWRVKVFPFEININQYPNPCRLFSSIPDFFIVFIEKNRYYALELICSVFVKSVYPVSSSLRGCAPFEPSMVYLTLFWLESNRILSRGSFAKWNKSSGTRWRYLFLSCSKATNGRRKKIARIDGNTYEALHILLLSQCAIRIMTAGACRELASSVKMEEYAEINLSIVNKGRNEGWNGLHDFPMDLTSSFVSWFMAVVVV